MKQPINCKCRMFCEAKKKHYARIVMGCTTLPPSEYTTRHNKLVGYIHLTICKRTGFTVLQTRT